MMGHSLAEDGDLTYHKEDLVRVWREFPSGPSGLFLKKGTDILDAGLMRRPPFVWLRTQNDPDQSRLFFGKSFAYPLVAAPFVKLFGTNGFLVLHAILMSLVVLCSFLFLHARMPAPTAALLAGAFVLVSIVPVYFVWIEPDLFNFALGLFAYFCWLYKEVVPLSHVTRRTEWLVTGRSDLVAAVLLGVATFSKPWSALLFPPIVLWLLYRRRLGHAIATEHRVSGRDHRVLRRQHGHFGRLELSGRRPNRPPSIGSFRSRRRSPGSRSARRRRAMKRSATSSSTSRCS